MHRTSLTFLILFGAQHLAAQAPASIELRPRHPSTADPIEFVVEGNPDLCWPAALVWAAPTAEGQAVVLNSQPPPGPLPPSCNFPGPHRVTIAPLAAGSHSVEFRLHGLLEGATAFEVHEPASEAALHSGRFLVQAWFRHPAGSAERAATAVPLSDASAHFWFFAARNVELTAKVLDGRGVNGAFWVFIASMTDLEYTVGVTDTSLVCIQPGCNVRLYQSPAGQNRNFIDTSAFPF